MRHRCINRQHLTRWFCNAPLDPFAIQFVAMWALVLSMVWFSVGPFPWCKTLFFFLFSASRGPSQPHPFQALSWPPGRGVWCVRGARGTARVCILARFVLIFCGCRACKNTAELNESNKETKTSAVTQTKRESEPGPAQSDLHSLKQTLRGNFSTKWKEKCKHAITHTEYQMESPSVLH